MSLGSILVLALGLAMDATAVAAARGVAVRAIEARHVALVALFFGGSQALMPALGWWLGAAVGSYVAAWDHWIAFALLGGIGAKMLWEARGGGGDDNDDAVEGDPFGLRVMTVLAIATSIDALAAGVTLPLLGAPFVLTIATIGVVTAVLSAGGLYLGRALARTLGSKLDIVGGLALVGLGVKILAEHLTAA
jgi:putative Mn2+ efflux pump MntP